jgi:hypothetical protein
MPKPSGKTQFDRSSAQLERTPGKPAVDTNNEAELPVVAVSDPLSRS